MIVNKKHHQDAGWKNPWFEKGTDQNGNPIYEAAIPNDGRDGVALNLAG